MEITCCSLLSPRVWSENKHNYGSHASDNVSWIFNDTKHTSYELFRPIGCFVADKAVQYQITAIS